jgi:5'(3')-deoxyribonucleotidase
MTDTVLLDVDGVLIDFLNPFLDVLQGFTGRRHSPEEMTTWRVEECIATPDEVAECWHHVNASPGWVRNLPLYPGAREFLTALRERYRVVACTSPASPRWAMERAGRLLELGFTWDDIVLTRGKSHVCGAALIDDSPANLDSWWRCQPGQTILFSRPWNRDAHPVHRRVEDYASALAALEELP